MNTFGRDVSCSVNVPNMPLNPTLFPSLDSARTLAPRHPLNFIPKTSFLSDCLTTEYDRSKVPSASVRMIFPNCPGLTSSTFGVSIVSSIVVGFKYFFSIMIALVVDASVSYGMKSDLVTPHTGHLQLSGMSENSVPGDIQLSSSPISGSYIYPHGVHIYFCHFL